MFKTEKKKLVAKTALLLSLMVPMVAMASGTGGDEFISIWDTLKAWIEGTLGRIITAGIVIVGIVAGIARQSLMAFAIGIGGGMGLYNSPKIIDELFSAVIPAVM